MQSTSVLDRPAIDQPSSSELAAAALVARQIGTREPARLLVAVDGSAAAPAS